jgi:peptidoglycan DL-endopeptidase CwlO
MSSHETGRHRAPRHHSSGSSFSSAISRSVRPAGKASAVIFFSGAMVASLALPASATTSSHQAIAPVALPVEVAAPTAAQAPLAPQTFGSIGFTGVVKPKPKPAAVPVVLRPAVAVSRSTTRAPIPTPAQQQAPVSAPGSAGVLGIAANLAGIYYIYGGTTTAGFDCSGFTQYVFSRVGISLPRTSEAQQAAATPVSNPQPGDLVFFGHPAGHVGIYAGNGMMWDSPHSGTAVGLHSVYSSSATYGRF